MIPREQPGPEPKVIPLATRAGPRRQVAPEKLWKFDDGVVRLITHSDRKIRPSISRPRETDNAAQSNSGSRRDGTGGRRPGGLRGRHRPQDNLRWNERRGMDHEPEPAV